MYRLDRLAHRFIHVTWLTPRQASFLFVTGLVFGIFELLVAWELFVKADQAGWKSLIPGYNYWTLSEIAGLSGWVGLAVLLYRIPVIFIVALAAQAVIDFNLAKKFGKSTEFAIFNAVFPFIGLPILALGKAEYSKVTKRSDS